MRNVDFGCLKSAVAVTMAVTLSCGAWAVEDERQVLWGDTHLHTKLSPDAYVMGNHTLTPDDAYRFAKGLPVIGAKTRQSIRLKTPLDFMVVTDHAEYMGVVQKVFEGDPELAETPNGKMLIDLVSQGKTRETFLKIVQTANFGKPFPDLHGEPVRRTVWQTVYEAADRHYQPGKFSSFVGWEWSSLAGGANLHRVVFMKEDGNTARKYLPYSLFESDRPEDLWQWLQETEERTGASFVAIPHNGNISKGKMFSEVDSEGRPLTAGYAKTRARWEPVYEMTQIKGDGETLAALSPEDEFAEFETYDHALEVLPGADTKRQPNKGDYARTALMRGLEVEQRVGVNPFKFGMIGASDSHSGVTAVEEDNFGGKFPVDSYPEGKSKPLTPGVTGYDMSSAGLSAVWAEENTRESIFTAFQRKEVYGTTGPRIVLRFFGGWDFAGADAQAADLAQRGYAKGVPMGGDLMAAPKGNAPSFLIHAAKDPVDANLDRIQVVKGWLDSNGQAHEKVFNVAASEGRTISNNQLEPVGNTVDLESASYSNSIGSSQLATVWTDPEFNPEQRAFYYVRVLQIPTPRHSLYASVALNRPHPEGLPAFIQERAYSSPIWYTP